MLTKVKLYFWLALAAVGGLAALYFRAYGRGKHVGAVKARMAEAKVDIKTAKDAGDTEALRRITLELLKY